MKSLTAQRQRQDVVEILLRGPAEGEDVFLGHQRIAKGVLLVGILHDGPGQPRALVQAQPLGHGPGGIVAHDHLQRDHLDLADQLFAHVQALYEMGRHADIAQPGHEELAQAVVEHALAVDHVTLLGVVGGGIVLEILHQGARLGPFIEHLRLALVDLVAPCHCFSVSAGIPLRVAASAPLRASVSCGQAFQRAYQGRAPARIPATTRFAHAHLR